MKENSAGLKRTGVLLALAGFCLYLPTLFQSFISDDNVYLSFKNRLMRNSTWADWYRPLIERSNPWEYLPLRDFSYWLDFRLYEYEGMGFHATNLIWYALAALAAGLLFRELILLCRPAWSARATTLAWCGAALFIVHPVHVEAVAWVASRKDLMSGCFALLSVFVLARNIRMQWSFGGSILATLLFLMACFSKAAGMTMALFEVALILSAWRGIPGNDSLFDKRKISISRKLFPLALLIGAAILAAIVHMKVGMETGIRAPGNAVPFADIIERASRILTTLMELLVWPHPLSFYHDVYAAGAWHWIASAFAIVAALAALLALLLQPTLWAFGVILLLAPCLVYLQLTSFGTWSLASERFVFVPVAGLVLIVIELCGRLSAARAQAVFLTLFLPCAVLTWQRVSEWDDLRHLRELDYIRAPLFHNAIRDKTFFLIAKGNEAEVKRLATTLSRPWATTALDALADVATAYGNENPWGNLFDSLRNSGDSHDDENHGDEAPGIVHTPDIPAFCQALPHLRAALVAGRAAMLHEPDLSYGNFLGSLQREVDDRYDFFEKRNCFPQKTQARKPA